MYQESQTKKIPVARSIKPIIRRATLHHKGPYGEASDAYERTLFSSGTRVLKNKTMTGNMDDAYQLKQTTTQQFISWT